MNCQQIQNKLDDYLDGELKPGAADALRAHLDVCDTCRTELEWRSEFRQQLRDLPVPPASPGFTERALRNARLAHEPKHGHNRLVGGMVGAAAAAALALWMVIPGGTAHLPPGGSHSIPGVDLPLQQAQTVNMVFNAPRNLQQVTFSMQLPEGVEIKGYPGQREVVWQANLHQGRNLLALPVLASRPGGGEVRTVVRYGNATRVFEVKLKVDGPAHSGALSAPRQTA